MPDVIINGKLRKEKTHKLTYIGAKIPTALYKEVLAYADANDFSFSFVVRRALTAYAEQVKK